MKNGSIRIDRESEMVLVTIKYKADKDGLKATKRDIVSWAIKQCDTPENEKKLFEWLKNHHLKRKTG